eukprot:Gregarina_sp_Poly_1__2141@NODE_1569_length_3826_cov_80_869912_g1036_i0_p1_GENE_NODE_1569_length_3826_cov_80_869912_g1036_i0NODE_1569_length_3826_cov_80_869912_g1036_i0_p1_ORF_typecomplete_len622_score46_72Aa_trans/PF01490_18/0_00017Aa_trans/PF01490_18/1_7DUF4386/PF14329_6/4_3e02DUF4386/PF14329_6/0_014DUF4386/PF14329_6/6e02_NODE_1569_length_3826_cov_80_869912_g1036_i02372102
MENTPFRITFVGGKKTITRRTAILMILNQLLAGGIEGVPLGYLLLGWGPMLLANMVLMALAMEACLMTARVMTMIPGNQLFNQRFEYVATVRHFLGENTSRIIEICFHLLVCHSLLSFNDAVAALETFITRPLFGSLVHFEWCLPSLPNIVAVPFQSKSDRLTERLKTPPWFTALRLQNQEQPHTVSRCFRIPLSYVLLAALATFAAGRNLEDDAWVQHIAFIFSAFTWLLIMSVCISKAPVWPRWIAQGMALLNGHDVSTSRSPTQILRNLVYRKVARIVVGFDQIRQLWLSAVNSLRWKPSVVATVLASPFSDASHFVYGGRTVPVRLPQLPMLSVPGVTMEQINSRYHPAIAAQANDAAWDLPPVCGTCYSDLCFDALAASDISVCPAPEWLLKCKESTVRHYIESRYAERRDRPPRFPAFFRKWQNSFAILAVFIRIWSVTDMVPSLVNELRTDVNVSQTFLSAFWIGGISIFITTFSVAVAFPGLDSFTGISPVTLITDSTLPQVLSNALLFSYAIFTIIPSKWKGQNVGTHRLWALADEARTKVSKLNQAEISVSAVRNKMHNMCTIYCQQKRQTLIKSSFSESTQPDFSAFRRLLPNPGETPDAVPTCLRVWPH